MIADEIRAVTKNYKNIRFNGELLALADRVEAVERDAERYRWLRAHSFKHANTLTIEYGVGFQQTKPETLDASIDRQMRRPAIEQEQADADR